MDGDLAPVPTQAVSTHLGQTSTGEKDPRPTTVRMNAKFADA